MAAGNNLIDLMTGHFHREHGLFQVDDLDAAFGGKNKAFHLGIPALSLVSKMHACFEKVLDSHIKHVDLLWLIPPTASSLGGHPVSDDRPRSQRLCVIV